MQMNRSTLCALFVLLGYALSAQTMATAEPLDGIYDNADFNNRRVLPEAPVREADVLWQQRIWRLIDSREKMNLPFRYAERPLFTVLREGISAGRIQAYSPETDDFSITMSSAEIDNQLNITDTIIIIDIETQQPRQQVVTNLFNADDVIYWRTKEVWYFDTRHSRMRVRTLGLAPVVQERTETGEIKYERPLFWVYLPHCRDYLQEEPVYNPANEKAALSWDDIFQMGFYSSHVYKEGNLQNQRLQDYLSGRDLLLQGERIEQKIEHREQDAWSY